MRQDASAGRRDPRRWFTLVRWLVLAQSLAAVITTIWNLPQAYQDLRNLTPGIGFDGWTTAQLWAAAQAAGLAPDVLAGLLFPVSLVCLLSFWGAAALLAWRKSDNWIGLLMVYILTSTAPGFSFLSSRFNANPADFLAVYEGISIALIWPTFFVLLFLFPDGRVVPRWARFALPLPYLAFFLGIWLDPQSQLMGAMQLLIGLFGLGGIASQIYRYRRVSSPAQRQQTKWVVAALSFLIVGVVLGQVIPLLEPELRVGTPVRLWFELVMSYLWGVLGSTLVPVTLVISILRYRLWDIDLIIRRTLQYAMLSGLLGLVYFGSVVVFRQLLGGLAGNSSAALVVSTLLVAVLFNPLRRRLQEAIDRRFYRARFDAARTLAEYAEVTRQEVALEVLTGELASVVSETLRPSALSLWLRPTGVQDAVKDRAVSVRLNKTLEG